MYVEQIKMMAKKLKEKYGTADPRKLCDAMKILVSQQPMGTSDGACKGFFVLSSRIKVITLNSNLPEHIQRIILAHELGHAVLHTREKLCTFHDFSVLSETSRLEYEANVFASELLLDDDEVLEMLDQELDFFRLASCLDVPPEMLDFKLKLLQKQGYPIQALNIAKSTFLKRNIDEPMV